MKGFRMKTRPNKGFTLIEILIVVVILGVLAGIVIPAYAGYTANTCQKAFIAAIKKIATVAEYHYQLTGVYFEDADSGQLPAGMDTYIRESMWARGTSIGGVWDFERDSFGVKSAFGVHFFNVTPQDDTYMQEIDAAFDDGDLTAGCFRKLDTDRFYYIVAQ
jgi:prepilin-type N-terminal cleavage/methylation domain-containing protein